MASRERGPQAIVTDEAAAERVAQIELGTFQVAYDIIGGGEEGSKNEVHAKEQADHSLPYLRRLRCSTARCCPSSTCPSGSPPPTCRSCCPASTSTRPPTSPGASRGSTAPACAFACATGGCSSASSTTTRGSPPGRWAGTRLDVPCGVPRKTGGIQRFVFVAVGSRPEGEGSASGAVPPVVCGRLRHEVECAGAGFSTAAVPAV